MARLDPTARVRNQIEEILAEGPISFNDLLDALVSRGLELGPEPDERLDDVLGTMERIDLLHLDDSDEADDHVDLCYDRRALVDGTTWTVPITELDLASDTVPTDSLGLLFMPLINEWCTLDGGDNIDIDAQDRRRQAADALGVESGAGIAFPEGWLADHGAKAGGFLLLQLDGDVVKGHGADVAPTASAALVDALVGTLGPESSSAACRHAVQMLTEVFVLHPELRGTQIPSLSDQIEAAGLARDGSYLARAGFDFEHERVRRRVQDVANRFEFREAEVQAYATLAIAWHGWTTKRDEVEHELLTAAAHALDLIPVATAFVDDECDPEESERLDEMVWFGEALIEAVSGRHQAGPAWLVAQALGVAGRTDRFEEWIDTALMFDGDHVLALYDKAWFEFDRGEAREGQGTAHPHRRACLRARRRDPRRGARPGPAGGPAQRSVPVRQRTQVQALSPRCHRGTPRFPTDLAVPQGQLVVGASASPRGRLDGVAAGPQQRHVAQPTARSRPAHRRLRPHRRGPVPRVAGRAWRAAAFRRGHARGAVGAGRPVGVRSHRGAPRRRHDRARRAHR